MFFFFYYPSSVNTSRIRGFLNKNRQQTLIISNLSDFPNVFNAFFNDFPKTLLLSYYWYFLLLVIIFYPSCITVFYLFLQANLTENIPLCSEIQMNGIIQLDRVHFSLDFADSLCNMINIKCTRIFVRLLIESIRTINWRAQCTGNTFYIDTFRTFQLLSN